MNQSLTKRTVVALACLAAIMVLSTASVLACEADYLSPKQEKIAKPAVRFKATDELAGDIQNTYVAAGNTVFGSPLSADMVTAVGYKDAEYAEAYFQMDKRAKGWSVAYFSKPADGQWGYLGKDAPQATCLVPYPVRLRIGVIVKCKRSKA